MVKQIRKMRAQFIILGENKITLISFFVAVISLVTRTERFVYLLKWVFMCICSNIFYVIMVI